MVLMKRCEPINTYKVLYFFLKLHGLTPYRIIFKNGFYLVENALENIIISLTIFIVNIISFFISFQATLNGVLGSFVSRLTLMLHIINICLNIVTYVLVFVFNSYFRNDILEDIFDIDKINKDFNKILSHSQINSIFCLSISTIIPNIVVGLFMIIFNIIFASKDIGPSAYFMTISYTIPFMVSNMIIKEFEFFLFTVKYKLKILNKELFHIKNKIYKIEEDKLSKVLQLYIKLCDKLDDVNSHFECMLLAIFITILFSMCQGALVVVLNLYEGLGQESSNLVPDFFSKLAYSYILVISYEICYILVFFHICEDCINKVFLCRTKITINNYINFNT